ncbi:hypothetical protein I317_07476 [Kwoniella heveanensis CBS 569]|nr:hypothetical protein I317_07476 [Kwoniella heveanensis CBS 569]
MFPSPSPPPGIAPAKRKQQGKAKADRSATPAERDGAAETAIEASPSHSSPRPSPAKRPRPSSIDTKRKASVNSTASTTIPTPVRTGLTPMRKYVREKLTPAFMGLFVDMDDARVGQFAAEVEESIYHNFKEVVGGKETAGTRYKTQFNLLNSSMAKGLRPDLAHSIIDGTFSASRVATLTSADLASTEQLAELERVKQAVLEQTVRAKEEVAAIRIGRDGFEKVENTHEKEMNLLAEQEEVARLRAEEAAKKVLEPVEPVEVKSPVVPDAPRFAPRRSESTDAAAASPLRQTSFSLSSAWGKDEEQEGGEAPIFSGDQNQVDLSDIVASDGLDDPLDDNVSEEKAGPTEMEIFEARPVVWSGRITNPAEPSPHTPPITARVVFKGPPSDYSILLPHKEIEITGRVPTSNALRFLSESRLNPAKELITVAFTLDPKASAEEAHTWGEMVLFHLGRDRCALYFAYGPNGIHLPPGGARELYMIPLRPEDPSPEFTDLIDGYSLPATGRTSPLFLGVFVRNKGSFNIATKPATSDLPVPAARPPQSTTTSPAPSTGSSIHTEQLAALMLSLNSAALQGGLGGHNHNPTQQGGIPPVAVPGFSGTLPTPTPPPPPQTAARGRRTPMPPPRNYPPYEPQGYPPYFIDTEYAPSVPYVPQPHEREAWPLPQPQEHEVWPSSRPRDPRRDGGRKR